MLHRLTSVALSTLLSLAGPAQAFVVDRVAVVIEDQLVMESEVAIEEALAQLDDSPSPFWSAGRTDAMDRLVDAAVLRHSAGSVALYQPRREEVSLRLEAVRSKFEDRSAWLSFLSAYGLDEERLAVVLRRRMVVERYLARNLTVQVEDRAVWQGAVADLLAQLRPRTAIRAVPVKH